MSDVGVRSIDVDRVFHVDNVHNSSQNWPQLTCYTLTDISVVVFYQCWIQF